MSHQTDVEINFTHADTLHFQLQPKMSAPDYSTRSTKSPTWQHAYHLFQNKEEPWHIHSQVNDLRWNNTNTASVCAWDFCTVCVSLGTRKEMQTLKWKETQTYRSQHHKTDRNQLNHRQQKHTDRKKKTKRDREQKYQSRKSWRFRQSVYRYAHWDAPDLWELKTYTDTQQHRQTCTNIRYIKI